MRHQLLHPRKYYFSVIDCDLFIVNRVLFDECMARGASSSISSVLIGYLTNFVVDMVWHEGLPRLPRHQHVYDSRGFIGYFIARGFIVYFVFIYFIDVDSGFTFFNTYFFARRVRCKGLCHKHQTRGLWWYRE
jgi:hypothetical protein